MLRASQVLPAGTWDRRLRVAGVSLDHDQRCRRRILLAADDGTPFLLDLPQAPRLRHGDGLPLEGRGVVEVQAAAEPLLELACADAGALARLAWHLGNRHVAAELRPDAIRIRADHVLADLAARLGAAVRPLEAPFEPEGGAYGGGHGHHHVRDRVPVAEDGHDG